MLKQYNKKHTDSCTKTSVPSLTKTVINCVEYASEFIE